MAKPNLKDALLRSIKALPNGAATIVTDPIQLQQSSGNSDFVAPVELLATVPNLSTGEIADTQTITVTFETSETADFASSRVIGGGGTVTGAGGIGASVAQFRCRPASDVGAFVRAKAVKVGASNASTSSLVLEVVA